MIPIAEVTKMEVWVVAVPIPLWVVLTVSAIFLLVMIGIVWLAVRLSRSRES